MKFAPANCTCVILHRHIAPVSYCTGILHLCHIAPSYCSCVILHRHVAPVSYCTCPSTSRTRSRGGATRRERRDMVQQGSISGATRLNRCMARQGAIGAIWCKKAQHGCNKAQQTRYGATTRDMVQHAQLTQNGATRCNRRNEVRPRSAAPVDGARRGATGRKETQQSAMRHDK